MFHHYKNGSDFVSEHVGIGRCCQPFSCQRHDVKSLRKLVQEPRMTLKSKYFPNNSPNSRFDKQKVRPPVLTWYLRASLQSTRIWSKFWGWSGTDRSMASSNWSGWWKSKILLDLSLDFLMKSIKISKTSWRKLSVTISALFPFCTGNNSKKDKFWREKKLSCRKIQAFQAWN